MKPITPVLKSGIPPSRKLVLEEVTYAKDQPQYNPLPVVKSQDGHLTSRWKLSFLERVRILFCGDVYLRIHTFNKPLQPVKLTITEPSEWEL